MYGSQMFSLGISAVRTLTDSKYAKESMLVGVPMRTSPDVITETPWNTATDIWSFGTLVG
jgi:hypothetical protein